MVGPIVEEIAAEQAGKLKVVKLNVDDNPDITRQYRVMSIPTLMVFSDGDERKRIVGARGKTQLLSEMSEFIGG
jgi:thioredoxin 1